MKAHQIVALLAFVLVPAAAAAQNASPAKPADAPRPPAAANVRIHVGIADQVAKESPVSKVVTMIVAEGALGSIRSLSSPNSPTLNVDALPRVFNGRIEVRLTLEYRAPGDKEGELATPVRQSITVLLDNGKPLVISQASDPSRDRRVDVEVTATILK